MWRPLFPILSDVGQFREVCYEIDLLCLSPNYTFKVCLQRECGMNNEVKNPFMKCLGNNSYLSELFLAGNCNFLQNTYRDRRAVFHVSSQMFLHCGRGSLC